MRDVIHIAHRTAFAFKLPPFEPEVACCDAKITRSLSAVSSRTSANRDIKKKSAKESSSNASPVGSSSEPQTAAALFGWLRVLQPLTPVAELRGATACVEAQQGRGNTGGGSEG